MATHLNLTSDDLNTPAEYQREVRALLARAHGALYLLEHDEARKWTARARRVIAEFDRRQRTHGYWPEPVPHTLVDVAPWFSEADRIDTTKGNHA